MVNLYTNEWEIKNIDTVLVDKDGTFMDSNPYWGRIVELRTNKLIKFYNIDKSKFGEMCLYMGYDSQNPHLLEKAPIALLSREALIDMTYSEITDFGIKANKEEITKIFAEVHKEFLSEMYDYIKIIDGAEDLFIRLKEKNVKLAVVTSDDYINAIKVLEHLNLTKYFDLVIGKDNCTQAKKTGEPALVALKQLNSKPEHTISIGDAPMDYEMAINAKLKGSILVATGQMSETSLKELTNTTTSNLKNIKLSD